MKRFLYFVPLFAVTLMISSCSREEKNTVVDWEGNEYKTKLYGHTWWMVENMRTTRTKDGQNIWVSSDEDKFSYSTPYCYFYNDNDANLKKKGCLYNWTAANEICPEGWHLPTVADYEALEQYLGSMDNYCYKGDRKAIAKAMASKNGWRSSGVEGTPGWNSATNNASGFNAFPVGCFWHDTERYFIDDGMSSYFWLAEEYDGNYAKRFSLSNNIDTVSMLRHACDKSAGISVRCVRQSYGGPALGD